MKLLMPIATKKQFGWLYFLMDFEKIDAYN
jgi:hypothetical protein